MFTHMYTGVIEFRKVPEPDRFNLAGSAVCLVGVAVIMYAPR